MVVKKAINDPDNLVREIAEGVVCASHGRVRILDDVNVLVRTAIEPDKVAIVVGGGSGHEPMYQGLIGPGFADAVACGNMFAAPTPEVILAATHAANQGRGVLYLQANYAGDNMNYEIAAELAADDGVETRTVRTGEDVSMPVEMGRRGLAGSFFTLKISGAACAEGADLEAAAAIAQTVADNLRSLSVAFSPGSHPETGEKTFSIADDEVEVGMGVHGEKGVATLKMARADPLTDLMIDKLAGDYPLEGGDRVALLVNDLGATTLMELYVVTRRAHQRLAELGVTVVDTWIGPYCTTQEMAGFSLTLLKVDVRMEQLLGRPASNESFLRP